jgi:sortase (surface protein transpeptidase)
MFNRQLTVISIVLLFVICLFAIASFRQEAQTTKPQQEEATVVQRGQLTEKEREYSKEYKKMYSYRKGYKLSQLAEAAKRNGNRQEVGVSIGEPSIPTVGTAFPVTEKLTGKEFLGNLSCSADAVVLGSVSSKTAHLTEDETFVYTEYEFSVKEVLKNNSASFIDGNTIQITRPSRARLLRA